MQEESKIYKILMAITETEAAAVDLLERMDDLRGELRDDLEALRKGDST